MITDELKALLEPLERFEEIRRRAVRHGPRLADLAYANPYAGVDVEVKAAIAAALDEERLLSLQYSPFGGYVIVRRSVADSLRSSHDLDFGYRDVVMTSGAMAALQVALHSVAVPDGEAIVPVPCWLDHPLYVRAAGMEPVMVPLVEGTFNLDIEAIAAALSDRTAAVVFSHPANPSGRVYDEHACMELASVLRDAETRFGTSITVIADETHRGFCAPGEFRSFAHAFDRTLIVHSFGKVHFMQGQRIGYVAASPNHPARDDVSTEMVRWTRILGVATPTSLMQRALLKIMHIEHDHSWIGHWRKRFLDELTASGYDVVEPDATLFIYVAIPTGSDDISFVETLADAGLLALPATVFHHAGYFRLSLTGSEPMLERALSVLASIDR